jgi:hypothetical protein
VHVAEGWRQVPETLEKREPTLACGAATYPPQLPLTTVAAPAAGARTPIPSATQAKAVSRAAGRVSCLACTAQASTRNMKNRFE